MTKKINFKIGPRDIELFTALDRCPMTAAQLCRLSETFSRSFPDVGNLRRRLRIFAAAGLVNKFPYAIAADGRTPSYYKLTKDGYRLMYGVDAALPKRRYFAAISPGHHHHTNSLAEVIVHLCLMAKKNDCRVLHFARENSVKLVAEPFTLYPDAAFVIERSDGRRFSFVVEFDNGTERVRSKQDVESIERKLRGYLAHQSKFSAHDPDRYLVLFITTRSSKRLRYVFETAAEIMANNRRTVFTGCGLEDFLKNDPFRNTVFENHFGLKRLMVPPIQQSSDNENTFPHVPNFGAIASMT
jgi:hypothetical protein